MSTQSIGGEIAIIDRAINGKAATIVIEADYILLV